MTLPLETINGKQYQPVECKGDSPERGWCELCVFNAGLHCPLVANSCVDKYLCIGAHRDDGANIYFIEPGDTNE